VRREGKHGFHCTDIYETRVCPAALCGETYTELRPYRSSSIDSAVESHLCLQVKRECDRADSQETGNSRWSKELHTEFHRNVQTIQSLLAGEVFFFFFFFFLFSAQRTPKPTMPMAARSKA
jgi:hypothetical protein